MTEYIREIKIKFYGWLAIRADNVKRESVSRMCTAIRARKGGEV